MGREPIIYERDFRNNERAYDLYSRLLKDRIVFVTGLIDSHIADSIVAQLLFLEADSKEKDIYMYINSPGGHVDAMYAMYDTMNYVLPDIVTVGYGTVASAASFLMAAGAKGKRYSLENSTIMIHELSSGSSGKFNDMRIVYKYNEKLYDKMAKHYVSFTGQDIDRIKKDMERDFFMTADEAKEYGLIDKVQRRDSR